MAPRTPILPRLLPISGLTGLSRPMRPICWRNLGCLRLLPLRSGRWMIPPLAVHIPMWLQPLLGTRNSPASRLYIHRVGQQCPLGSSGSAKSSLENIRAISAPRRDTEQTDHTGYHQPSRFWLRDSRRVSQDVERELALTGCDIPIKSVGAYCYCTCVSWSGKIPVIGRRGRGSFHANPVQGSCSQHQGGYHRK